MVQKGCGRVGPLVREFTCPLTKPTTELTKSVQACQQGCATGSLDKALVSERVCKLFCSFNGTPSGRLRSRRVAYGEGTWNSGLGVVVRDVHMLAHELLLRFRQSRFGSFLAEIRGICNVPLPLCHIASEKL